MGRTGLFVSLYRCHCPAFSSKVISLPHRDPFVPDYERREADVEHFFSVQYSRLGCRGSYPFENYIRRQL